MFSYITLNGSYQIGHTCPATDQWRPNPDYDLIDDSTEAYRIVCHLNGMEFGYQEETFKEDPLQTVFQF